MALRRNARTLKPETTVQHSFVNHVTCPVVVQFGELELRETDTVVREQRKTPVFAHRNFCNCVPFTALQHRIRAEHT
jgi:hypothetical protein